MSEYRTHTCGELTKKDEGSEVKLSGFVKTIRDLGGCVFIDLRDHYGITQLTTEDEKLLEKIKNISVESTIKVTGKVCRRPEENINDKLFTPIDYMSVGKNIEKNRDFSISYLISALKNETRL